MRKMPRSDHSPVRVLNGSPALARRRARLCSRHRQSEYRSLTATGNRRFGGARFHRSGLLGTVASVLAVAHANRSADARCLWREQDISPMYVRLRFNLVSVCMGEVVMVYFGLAVCANSTITKHDGCVARLVGEKRRGALTSRSQQMLEHASLVTEWNGDLPGWSAISCTPSSTFPT